MLLNWGVWLYIGLTFDDSHSTMRSNLTLVYKGFIQLIVKADLPSKLHSILIIVSRNTKLLRWPKTWKIFWFLMFSNSHISVSYYQNWMIFAEQVDLDKELNEAFIHNSQIWPQCWVIVIKSHTNQEPNPPIKQPRRYIREVVAKFSLEGTMY